MYMYVRMYELHVQNKFWKTCINFPLSCKFASAKLCTNAVRLLQSTASVRCRACVGGIDFNNQLAVGLSPVAVSLCLSEWGSEELVFCVVSQSDELYCCMPYVRDRPARSSCSHINLWNVHHVCTPTLHGLTYEHTAKNTRTLNTCSSNIFNNS